ncbi:General transcription factor IIF subunit 1 [Chionoecetes opilio]|uniref:Transcription initiation factor IIF subunit alpha n=1 Tax=Chionoecetes opilio TaxID=41210 RepID=A0A8J4YCZ7_CHIOP|nr:General transcription factor IIF subunit 1 [Chionoecetes opilio]
MMRFHAALGVDFKTWAHTKMERENNMKEFKGLDEDMPRYGAGSEFGREQREEARRKKYGINIRKYKPDDQPWLLSAAGKNGKKFKGIREGGVSENSSWYVFMQGKDGAFEAYPVEEWYNFKLIQRYKSLSAEEAEREFERRDKIMNYFSVMYQKKLKKEGDDPAETEEERTKKKGQSSKSLMLSELDDWMSDDGSDGSDKEDDGEEVVIKKKKKVQSKNRTQQGGKKKKNLEGNSDEDCLEESDEYDDGAEHDYICSDSSDKKDGESGGVKRKMKSNPADPSVKRQRTDLSGGGASSPMVASGSDSGVTEESIRRYLMRKPMTTTELLQKCKSKKTSLSSEQLVHAIAHILKRINPSKQMVKGKMYLSFKQ